MNEPKDFEYGVDATVMDTLGQKLYGEQWARVRAHNIKRLKGDMPSPLPQSELDKLVKCLRILAKEPQS